MNLAPSLIRAQFVTENNQLGGYLVRLSQLLLALLLAAACSATLSAQDIAGDDTDWVIFVSQRSGAAELFLLNTSTRQVSQLTETGRGHITPATAANAKVAAFASVEGSKYELFTAQISSAWRTRRPLFSAVDRLTVNTINETNPSLTANGSIMAFSSSNGIEVMWSNGEDRRVLIPASDKQADFGPAISPNGRQVAFVSNRSGANEIWLANAVSGEVRQLTQGAQAVGALNWSPDSRQIVFTTTATNSKLSGIAITDVTEGTIRVLTEGGDGEPAMSSDGSRIVFTSNRDGDPELYLLTVATGAIQRLTNSPGLDGAAVFVANPTASRRTSPTRSVETRGIE